MWPGMDQGRQVDWMNDMHSANTEHRDADSIWRVGVSSFFQLLLTDRILLPVG